MLKTTNTVTEILYGEQNTQGNVSMNFQNYTLSLLVKSLN